MDAILATIFDDGDGLAASDSSKTVQPLRMAAHASEAGNSSNPHHRGGKRLTMVVMFVGCFLLGADPNIVLFLPYKTYRAGFFSFPPESL